MPAYNADQEKFAGLDAQVVGISWDSQFCPIGWQEKDIGLMKYPLCSAVYPHGAVIQKYGLLRRGPPLPGISERAIFVVDRNGRSAFAKIYDLGKQPPNEALREA